jgi:hypothetical protein
LDFSDQFSYIKLFFLSYHLKVIEIIVFIKKKQKNKKQKKTETAVLTAAGLIRVQRLQAVGFKRPEPLDALHADRPPPPPTPFCRGSSHGPR